ncbi:GNAT family [Favolaschia claudopus]|uniref:GNAT family n=1 Tax=Favolaschia claudopus TaxID=2862362 RepID=A0AAW0CFU2_9AGAR
MNLKTFSSHFITVDFCHHLSDHMSATSYEVFRIPIPPSKADIMSYSQIRLLGLKTNPEAFGSKFEVESLRTFAEWKARVENEDRFTIIARATPPNGGDGDCVGTASILTPAMVEQGPDVYGVVGMWVHPEHRMKGLGRRMLEFGIDWVRERPRVKGGEARRLVLEVHRPNEAAKALYGGLGFLEAKEEKCEDPNRIPMFLVVE